MKQTVTALPLGRRSKFFDDAVQSEQDIALKIRTDFSSGLSDVPNSIFIISNLKFSGISVIFLTALNVSEDCGQLLSKQWPIRLGKCSSKSNYYDKISAFLVEGVHHKLSITLL